MTMIAANTEMRMKFGYVPFDSTGNGADQACKPRSAFVFADTP